MQERTILEFPTTRHARAYDPDFDIQAFQDLSNLKVQLPFEEYKRREIQLHLRTLHNLETNLGERFNVQLSTIEFTIKNGQLKSAEYDEPFIEIVKKGVDFRKINGNPTDHKRERAELKGFTKIQDALTQPHIIPNFKVISVSPRGQDDSDYKLNFFDIYDVVDKNCITMTRYASKMTYIELLQAAQQIDPIFETPTELTDSFFLSSPIETMRSFEDILEVFHPDLQSKSTEELEKLLKACKPLFDLYIKDPSYDNYIAILNFSDEFIFKPNIQHYLYEKTHEVDYLPFFANQLAKQPVRQVATGCGLQGGLISPYTFIFSVADFALNISTNKDEYGTLEIHCEECGASYNRTPGKLEEKCRLCGGTKGIAC